MHISPINSIKPSMPVHNNNKLQQQHQKIFGGSLADIFTSSANKDIDEIKNIKTKEGNARFNNKEIKEIKSLKNKDKIDNEVIKQFADTMLDVKSISEVYLHAKDTSKNEYGIIKNIIKPYEEPFKDWPDSLREDYHTKFERTKINGESAYKISDCMERKTGVYGAGGKMYSECTVTAGPYYSGDSDNDESSSTSSNTNSQQDSNGSHPLDANNPFNPLYW